ncbi:uncharacterized protein LOC131676981 [Topomyia yanbarensis]|uniref:uncharacterized protein LOC131676981 n=1 Tax=Topomyia yanbarensis TaxID=2498891 RepID=UPI00273BA605|nr:uncharacterized protein LOC131676981 [Topomyia yanbarensis]
MGEAKRGNATQMQLSLLDEFMNKHKELARGSFMKTENGKDKCNKLWVELKTKLNAVGPPVKTVAEWKRVWTTRKYKTKTKLSSNKKSLKKTGGGPYSGKELTFADESIIEACGLEATVTGIPGVASYGFNSDMEEEDDRSVENIPTDDYLMESVFDHQTAGPSLTTRPHAPKEKKNVQLLEKQVEISQQFLDTCSETLQKISSSQADVSMHLRSLKHDFRKLVELKQEEYKEKKDYRKKKLKMLEESGFQKSVLKKEQLELQKLNIEVLQTTNELKKLKLSREDE